MSRLVGRTALVGAVRAHLAAGRAVALHGPTGTGKSALLDELEALAQVEGTRVLRAAGARPEQQMAWAVLQDFLDQTPSDLLDELPITLQGAVRRGLVGVCADEEDRGSMRRAWLFLLDRMAQAGPVLVLVDDAQWVDGESREALQYAGRRLVDRVGFVVTLGPGLAVDADAPVLTHVEVPPLDPDDLIELLGRHGVAAQVAHRIAAESGGLPSLALAMGGAVGELPTVLGRPTATPPSIERMLKDRVLAQPKGVQITLLHAAMMLRPTVRQLVRAGRSDADSDLRAAALAGLVALRDDTVRFTPQGLVGVIGDLVDAGKRAQLHRDLARVAVCPEHRIRHEALAGTRPDADLARRLEGSAGDAARRGARELAAELYLLAADRAPVELAADRVEWLSEAIEVAALGNHADLVYRSLDEFLAADASPAQRVRVRLALVELAGTGLSLMDEVLTTALADAAGDPVLLAGVFLQKARVQLMESRPVEAEKNAAEAVRLLAGDDQAVALALPILAVSRRWIGAGDHDDVLRQALLLPEPDAPGLVHTTPRYIAARFAYYDDRLDEAWSEQQSMLATLERGSGIDLVHVLRCLVETGSRLGRAREVMAYAARAIDAAGECDLDPHTGWYISAVAELTGGELERARVLAERGVALSDQQGDTRYLQRHLLVLSQALLRLGDARAAVGHLERMREIEIGNGICDPTANRWQAELVSALVATGDLERAADILAEARKAVVGRTGIDGVAAQLDRSEAELLLALSDGDGASELVDRSAAVCAELGMRIDLGRALLARAHVERRRRRGAAARAALEAAYSLFSELQAIPWAGQAAEELGSAPRPATVILTAETLVDKLTATEARIACAVAGGASNREIAERMFLSVKTVEATLTRIYRKLGIRSRTQLATLVR